MKTRIQARAVTLSPDKQSMLLVRNRDAAFWYAPGGGLEENEDIKQCAVREMLEETGLRITLKQLLYVQELHDKKDNRATIELFWLAELAHSQTLDEHHTDIDPEGDVAEARWFTRGQLQNITVYPAQLKDSFWSQLDHPPGEDLFLGVFD